RPVGALAAWRAVGSADPAALREVAAILPGPDEPERTLYLGHPRSPIGALERMAGGPSSAAVDALALRLASSGWAVEILDQVVSSLRGFPEPVADPDWRLEIGGYEPAREQSVESLLSVANGRVGTRGSLEEGGNESAATTYVAGLFGRAVRAVGGPELVVGPDWTSLAPRCNGEPLRLDRGTIRAHVRTLDLRQGALFRTWWHRTPGGADVRFRSARLASLADRRLVALEASAEASGAKVELADGIPIPRAAGPIASVHADRHDHHLVIEVGARAGGRATFAIATRERAGRLERLVGVGRDGASRPEAEDALRRARAEGMARIHAAHRRAWRARWRAADIVIEGDEEAQQHVRFALYHLISAADPGSDVASIGARGLTGPGYRGHVFWDTEVFMLPFFIHTDPATARALLAYRYRTLPAARLRARARGCAGALFAWESADTGEEVAPSHAIDAEGRRVEIRTGEQEEHISADVAWAAWRYWEATADDEFLFEMGAEIILETARYWASRASLGADGGYHIARVIGPDEYHEGVSDNAFTNVMARWNLERALEVASWMERLDPVRWRRLGRRLAIGAADLGRWREVAARLVDGFDPGRRVYEQFAGFFGLEEVPLSEIAERPVTADIVLGRERTARSQVVKQADVLMLALMLPDLMTWETLDANYRFYEPRTAHGSSLSPPVHAAVAARCGHLAEAHAYLRMSGRVDLGDVLGNAASGLHMATLGGIWQAAVFGFGGVRPSREGLRVDPRLAPGWRRLRYPLMWRGSRVRVEATSEEIVIDVDAPAVLAVGEGPMTHLEPGRYRARRGDERAPALRIAS
ncbi:MAG: glycosyl hydrolase family 65 protein, partial [Candidatus Limnocylindria bacterium]